MVVAESDSYKYANHNASDEELIVKVYWRGLRPNSIPWELFNREYRTSEILIHRNIVKILGRGLYSGYPFVVMEFLPGGTLRDLLQARTHHIPGQEVLSIAEQIVNAIDYAHTQGVVHRDIKYCSIYRHKPNGSTF